MNESLMQNADFVAALKSGIDGGKLFWIARRQLHGDSEISAEQVNELSKAVRTLVQREIHRYGFQVKRWDVEKQVWVWAWERHATPLHNAWFAWFYRRSRWGEVWEMKFGFPLQRVKRD